jgi:hypothetical protein
LTKRLETRQCILFNQLAKKWKFKSTFHHLIALFCTVSAKTSYASGWTTNFSNEIKGLAVILEVEKRLNRSKLST